jgi:hypothetical protein
VTVVEWFNAVDSILVVDGLVAVHPTVVCLATISVEIFCMTAGLGSPSGSNVDAVMASTLSLHSQWSVYICIMSPTYS